MASILQLRPRAPQSARNIQKGVYEYQIRHENVLQDAEKHTSTHRHKQPTNQGDEERRESANNQTNEQTLTYTLTQTITLTTRPLKSSFELQTQTQTPAAGCSPKAT